MTWYLVAKPLLAVTEVRHFLYLAMRFAHISGGILSLSSLQILSKSLRVRLATRTFSSLHRFSMGLRSGDWLGHSRTFICLFLSHSFVSLAVCFGSLSWWSKTLIHDPFSMPWLASMPWPWCYLAPPIVPLMWCSCPVPLAEKHPQSIMFPPPCLTVGIVFLGS